MNAVSFSSGSAVRTVRWTALAAPSPRRGSPGWTRARTAADTTAAPRRRTGRGSSCRREAPRRCRPAARRGLCSPVVSNPAVRRGPCSPAVIRSFCRSDLLSVISRSAALLCESEFVHCCQHSGANVKIVEYQSVHRGKSRISSGRNPPSGRPTGTLNDAKARYSHLWHITG